MHSANFFLVLGFTLAGTTGAAPLSDPTPTMRPLFTVVSRIPVSISTEVANATAGKFFGHKHTPGAPECDHKYNVNHNRTTDRARNSTADEKGHATEAQDKDAKSTGIPLAYPDLNVDPHTGRGHNHTGYRCAHPSHRNGSAATGHSYDKKALVPEVDVTVCVGDDCDDSTMVTAKVDDAGKLTGIEAKNSPRLVEREEMEFSYEDLAKQMSGALTAGGV